MIRLPSQGIRLNANLDVSEHGHGCRNKRELAKVLTCAESVDFILLKDSAEYSEETERLYQHLFPIAKERIPWERLSHAIDLHSYLDLGTILEKGYNSKVRGIIALKQGHVAGLAFFKNVPLEGDFLSVLMYIGVADNKYMKEVYGIEDNMRGLGIGNTFHAMVRSFSIKDSIEAGYIGRTLGLLGDSEFVGQSLDIEQIRYTMTRLKIHASLGMYPVLLDCGSDVLISPSVQPPLNEGSEPLLMHLIVKNFDMRVAKPPTEIDIDSMERLMEGYVMSYDSVDSDSESIAWVAAETKKRLAAAKKAIILRPPDIPDICTLARMDPLLREQVERDFGSIAEHEIRIKKALG